MSAEQKLRIACAHNEQLQKQIAKLQEEVVRWDDLKQSLGIDSPVGFLDYVMAKDRSIAALEHALSLQPPPPPTAPTPSAQE